MFCQLCRLHDLRPNYSSYTADAVRVAALQKPQATLADVQMTAESYELTAKTVSTIKDRACEKQIQINATGNKKNTHMYKENKKHGKYKSCSGCFRSHKRENCKFKNGTCNKCGKRGHISPVCMSTDANDNNNKWKKNRNSEQKNNIDVIDTIFEVTGEVSNNDTKSYIVVQIQDKMLKFQMDSGASISIINLKTYNLLNKPKLVVTKRTLFGFGRKIIPVLGELHTSVKCGKHEKDVVIVVVNTDHGENIFGFDMFKKFGFAIQQIKVISDTHKNNVENLCDEYNEVFEPALGTINNFKANIRLKSDAQPKIFRSRQIPFAQMQKFKQEIDRLVNLKILSPIKFSEWASPIVLVVISN